LNNPVLSPQEQLPASDWEHYILYKTIKDLLIEIPHYFESTISVSGVRATEIYPFSAVLGLMIEQEVVRTLNNLRQIWDANKQYAGYRFIRQSQAFPDVLLMNPKTGHIIFGIELKCWYLLAKEGEPSFRYHATPNVCTIADLIVIVPWVLSNVLSGAPVIFNPFIASARYVAEYRNYWWQHIRKAKSSSEIHSPSNVVPYPRSRDKISDHAESDSGNNFGRIARIGLLDTYAQSFRDLDLIGVTVSAWRAFLKAQPQEFDISEVEDQDNEG